MKWIYLYNGKNNFFSKQIGYSWFLASPRWVTRWKKANKIVSRKITKVTSKKQIRSLPNVSATVSAFRTEARNKISKYRPQDVFNSDQSGFNIELLSGRTLAVRGSADVVSSVQQSQSFTHSYTIQPLVSMNGELIRSSREKRFFWSEDFQKFVLLSRNISSL